MGLAQGKRQSQDSDLGFQTPHSRSFRARAPLPAATCSEPGLRGDSWSHLSFPRGPESQVEKVCLRQICKGRSRETPLLPPDGFSHSQNTLPCLLGDRIRRNLYQQSPLCLAPPSKWLAPPSKWLSSATWLSQHSPQEGSFVW